MKSSSSWDEEEVEVEYDDADDEEEDGWLGRIGGGGWFGSAPPRQVLIQDLHTCRVIINPLMAQVEKENVDLDVAEHLHQAYRLVFISSAWFRPLLSGFNNSSLVLT